jgi:O-antigen/teichoic acid export membrane protein
MSGSNDQEETVRSGSGILARNTIINLFGQGIPLLVALVSFPLLVKGLGTEKFGVLNLVWMIIGYFSLFDLGVSRATTKFVAEHLAVEDLKGLPRTVWTSWIMLLGLGIAGGMVLASINPLLVKTILNVPDYLLKETSLCFYLIAPAIPVVLCTAGIRGVLEAQQRFDLINAVEMPAAVINYVVPLIVLLFTHSLIVIVAVLLIGRMLVLFIYIYICLYKTMPLLRSNISVDRQSLKRVLNFGGWLTVSNIVGPVMVYMDRFLIGTLLTLSAVSYYVVPYTAVTKLWIIPGSLLAVLFPAFSGYFIRDKSLFALQYRRAVKFTFIASAPIVIPIAVLSSDLMVIWMGADFAENSAVVLAWIAVGVLVNSLAQVPFTLIQAAGRPDITAKFHLLEVIPYLGLLYYLIVYYGIIGAAIAWSLRVTADAIMLFWYAKRILPSDEDSLGFSVMISATLALYFCTALSARLFYGVAARFAVVLGVMVLAVLTAWFLWMDFSEREMVRRNCRMMVSMIRGVTPH